MPAQLLKRPEASDHKPGQTRTEGLVNHGFEDTGPEKTWVPARRYIPVE